MCWAATTDRVPGIACDHLARRNDTGHFANARQRLRHKKDHQSHHGNIETICLKRQSHCVADAEFGNVATLFFGIGDLIL